MPVFKSKSQAVQLVDAVYMPGPKPQNKVGRIGFIFGEQTRAKYISALTVAADWAKANYRLRLVQLSTDQVQEYLYQRAAEVGSRQINQDCLAVCLIPGIEREYLDKPRSLVGFGEKATEVRALTLDAMYQVIEALPERHRFSGELAAEYGLRAGELLTIQRADELDPKDPRDRAIIEKMARRDWNEDRFHGQEGVRYVVVGKGGLPRERVFSYDHSRRLEEEFRLPKPRAVKDRTPRNPVMQRYDLTGGKRFSEAWTNASRRVLGDSPGAHCVRHSYACDRMEYHLNRGLDFNQAYALVAQELGHFDPNATREYLRSLPAA